MTVSVEYEMNLLSEQNINTKELKIPEFVTNSIQNLIEEDRFNLFKIKSESSIDEKLKQIEVQISKLLKIKNEANEYLKKLEEKLIILKKNNSKLEMELKKKLNI